MKITTSLLHFLLALCTTPPSEGVDADPDADEPLRLRVVRGPGVILHKTPGPLEEGPVGDAFPGSLPARFIREAYGVDVARSVGGRKIANRTVAVADAACGGREGGEESVCGGPGPDRSEEDLAFGRALLSRAKEMFDERGRRDELDSFLDAGASNPDAGPRRMHWATIEILPNQSLALHSHPNVEFAYIVEGVMHEHRIVSDDVEKKRRYVPEKVEVDGEVRWKHRGPDHLVDVDASSDGIFRHITYAEGDMFINVIGDVHQSFAREEGAKLFVMWGDGNADVAEDRYPKNSEFLNPQSAKAWD
ncbi:hypothetical protein ACHAWF_001341 [Thalassiosira exigua]